MREVEGFTCGEVRLDRRPKLHLSCVAQQHTNDGTFFGSFFQREEGLSGHPSIGYSLVVGLALTLADDDIKTIVTEVACLTGALYAVAEHCNRFVLQHLTRFFERELFAGHYFFNDTAKIQFCHFTFLLNCCAAEAASYT